MIARISIATIMLLPAPAFAQSVINTNNDLGQIMQRAWSIAMGLPGAIFCGALLLFGIVKYAVGHHQHGMGKSFIAVTAICSLGWLANAIWGIRIGP